MSPGNRTIVWYIDIPISHPQLPQPKHNFPFTQHISSWFSNNLAIHKNVATT